MHLIFKSKNLSVAAVPALIVQGNVQDTGLHTD